ncbi:TetR/AcrR family transcriptional regulator [Cellulomonas endometrii]|uniref:TetR/AcrR family transcriptional regulator n=1 Tax=Cellulomonas endometrii TaxID=3036301 RepID=UPI0024AE7776|nr:TetR/AcrR family transcriptional regulator [Cellulomonas endometrii]
MTEPDDQRPPGRPRAADLERRALRAVLDIFGEKGWTGLTIAEVATRAKVGKSSLYLRWPDKTAMLADALSHVQAPGPDASDDGEGAGGPDGSSPPAEQSLRDFLIQHAHRRADLYLGEDGLAMLRLYVEARAFPEPLADVRHEAITRFVLRERHRVERAIDDGELPPGASVVHLLDAIEGSVLMHVLVTPPHLLDRVRSTLPAYIERLVDLQLAAVARAPLPVDTPADAPGA